MRSVALLAAALVGTAGLVACAYKPGSYASTTHEFVGQRITVGCLDLAIERQPDHDSSAVLRYTFGNRCDRPAAVDLAWVNVIGRTSDGAEIALEPYDPDGELRVLRLDGRLVGREAIAYPTSEPLGQVCVDAASIAQQRPAQWLCFGSHDAMAMVTP